MDRAKRIAKLKPLLHQVLYLLGEDVNRDGLQKTPERWADALLTYNEGMLENPENELNVLFHLDDSDYPEGSDDIVMVSNIEFTSTCEHHMAPIQGVAHIGYVPHPNDRLFPGLSKLTRVVEIFAKRLQVQERMTQQIARAIDEHIHPLGVIIVVQAVHFCLIQRSVNQRSSTVHTTAKRGVFRESPDLEARFQNYLKLTTLRS